MGRFLLTILFTINSILTAISQKSRSGLLISKFKNADSVFVVSHDLVSGSTDEAIDQNGKSVSLPGLIVNGRLNAQVTKQKVLLTSKQIDTLLSILTVRSKDLVSSQGACFIPHHAIIIVTKDKTSFIDLCFQCLSFRTSDDISRDVVLLKTKWVKLEKYFINRGLTYGMEQQGRR